MILQWYWPFSSGLILWSLDLVPSYLFKCSLKFLPYHGEILLLPEFPTGLRDLACLKIILFIMTETKNDTRYLGLHHVSCHKIPCLIQQQACICVCVCVCVRACVFLFFFAIDVPTRVIFVIIHLPQIHLVIGFYNTVPSHSDILCLYIPFRSPKPPASFMLPFCVWV